MNANCTIHKDQPVVFITMDMTQDCIFKCDYCVSEENISQYTLIPINLILTSDVKTIFMNYPITDRALALKIRTLAQAPSTSIELTKKIVSFFKDFRASFIQKLETIETKMIEKAQNISDLNDSLIEQYNKICAKDQLRDIISQKEKPVTEKSQEIKTICEKILSKSEENNSSIQKALDNLTTIQSAIDFETPNKIKDEVISYLDKINMFLISDFSKFNMSEVNSNLYNPEEKIQKLMKLVNNSLNGISAESQEKLQEQLSKISFAFSGVEVPEIGATGTYLSQLNQDQSQVIIQLIEDHSKIQKVKEENDEGEDTESLNTKDIIKLLSNKSNFCSYEYIEDVAKVMNSLEKVLGQFQVRKPRIKTKEQEALNNLNEEQLLNLVQLAIKTNQITEKHADSYLNSQSPLENILPNSTRVVKKMGDIKHYSLFQIEGNSLSKVIDKLMVTYPIFELLPENSFPSRIPLRINFTKSKYVHSSEIQISQNAGSIEINLDVNKYGQVVSDVLDSQLGYLLKLKFTKPIEPLTSCAYLIGLIQDSQIDSTHVLSNSYQAGLDVGANSGASIALKGAKLTSSELRKTTDTFEFLFCVSKKLFLYSDPSHANINKVEENLIDPSKVYRFGIYLNSGSGRPSDFKVQVTEFCIIDHSELNLI